jgi:energy-coupling factor transport system permease protein
MMCALYLCTFADNFLTAFVSMTIICFRKIMPTVFFASGMLATTKVSDLIGGMQKLHIPKVIVIPFAVTLRFFPTAKEEFSCIRDAMKLRGLAFSVERALVPLMLRSANIAEELSAAAVTRGIESDLKRSSMNELRMKFPDWSARALFVGFSIFAIVGGAL